MEYRTFLKVSGCVVDVKCLLQNLFLVFFVQVLMAHSRKLLMDVGPMSSVHFGLVKLAIFYVLSCAIHL